MHVWIFNFYANIRLIKCTDIQDFKISVKERKEGVLCMDFCIC